MKPKISATAKAAKPAKPAKLKKIKASGPTDGFLIPENRRRQSMYRHHPVFRSTLLILFLGILLGGLGGYRWHLAKQVLEIRQATTQLITAEGQRLQNQNTLLKTIKDRYRELEILLKQLRIPLSPVLDSIEKTIPNEISINGIDFRCTPSATTGGTRRRAQIAMDVFLPDTVQPSDPIVVQWPDKIFEKMAEHGLKGINPEWGPPQELIIPKQPGKTATRGNVRRLTYQIELIPQGS